MFDFFNKNNNSQNNEEYWKEVEGGNLQVKYANLESKYQNALSNYTYLEKEHKKLKGMTENLCKSIMSNEYNLNQLGGQSILQGLDIYKLIEFTTIDFQKQRISNLELVKQLNEQIQIQANIIETLKQQLTQAMIQNSKDLTPNEVEGATIIDNSNVFDEEIIIEQPKKAPIKIERDNTGNITKIENKQESKLNQNFPKVNNANANLAPKPQEKVKISPKPQSPVAGKTIEDKNSPKLTIENIASYMDAMTEPMWDIVYAIGSQGFAKSNDIVDYINKDGEKHTKSAILTSITSLRKMSVLTNDTISTGYRRFQVYKLSTKGEAMYKSKYGKDIVESEIDKIIRDHDNIIHGYTIRDTKELLLDVHKCKSANMERSEVSIKLPNNKTYIPDIIAINPNGEKMYIEVELGNTPQRDFNDKCTKMMEVTKNFYFVTDTDNTIKSKLEGQVSMWVLQMGGKEKVSGITVYITTTTQLSRGEWSKVIPY